MLIGSKKEVVSSLKQPAGSLSTTCRLSFNRLQAVNNCLQVVAQLPIGGRHTPCRVLTYGLQAVNNWVQAVDEVGAGSIISSRTEINKLLNKKVEPEPTIKNGAILPSHMSSKN